MGCPSAHHPSKGGSAPPSLVLPAGDGSGSFVLLVFCLICITLLPNLSQAQLLTRFEFSEPHMGTLCRIICYAADPGTAKQASKAAFARIANLDDIMSDYSPTSELTRLNQQSGGPSQKVSPDLFLVLSEAQQVSEMTDGAFDVTVGPVVKLWRRARRRRELPDPARLAQVLSAVGFRKLQLSAESQSVRLVEPGMALDLGGIAKGYAADEGLRVLRQSGLSRALVAAGGDIVVGGPPPGTEGWTIGVSPLEPSKSAMHLLLSEAAVSTSGDAEQFVEIGGKRYSHIVDPKTGIGLIGHRSVTVVAPKGIISDSLATALCVMGPARGLAIVDSLKERAALFVETTGDGVRTFRSKRWKESNN
jgi:FAD:protein FMN transferase